MDADERAQAKQLHSTLDYIGLRAQATAVAVLQVCAELARAGVFDREAVDRIKSAVRREILVSYKQQYGRKEFEDTLSRRLDAIFPGSLDVDCRETIGSINDLEIMLDEAANHTRTED